MSNLVFACLAPHGWLTIPLLSGEEAQAARKTRAALEELARRLAQVQPETLVVVTPHGLMVDGCVSLLNAATVRGGTAGMPWTEHSPHSVCLEFTVDQELNAAIRDAAAARDVPAVCVRNHADWEPLLLDFGSLIPLWFLGATLIPRPRVVIACADRGERGLSGDVSRRLGQAVRAAADATGRRVALIASGDLGHAHDPEGPYGYDEASKTFDAAVVKALQAGDLGRLSALDPDFVLQAKTDAYGPLMTLHGATDGSDLRADFLSYEVPAYFGMACAAFAPTGEPQP